MLPYEASTPSQFWQTKSVLEFGNVSNYYDQDSRFKPCSQRKNRNYGSTHKMF